PRIYEFVAVARLIADNARHWRGYRELGRLVMDRATSVPSGIAAAAAPPGRRWSAPGRAWSSAAALTHQGRLRGMDGESASRVLATPLAQELLRSSPLAHLAYIGRDGYPRVIPTGYVWKGGKFVVCTPDNAPKVRSLGSNPRVALSIDTQTQPPRILLVRGTASMEFVDGVPDDYLEASHKYVPRKEWDGFDAQVRRLYPRMARISITPEWAKPLDFERTLPQAVEELLAQRK